MLRPLRPIALSAMAAVSIIGAGAGLLYLLLKQDDELGSLTFEQSKRQRQCIEIIIPKDNVGVLIGRGGANIKDIQDKTDTKITFKDESGDSTDRTCMIRGLPEKTQQAEAMIHEFLAKQPKLEIQEVWVPQAACGRIIGRSGTTIRAMVKASGAKINLEGDTIDDTVTERRIVIRGTEAQVALAKSLIEEKVEEDKELRRSVEFSTRAVRSPNRSQLSITAGSNEENRSCRRSVERLTSASQGGFLEVYVSAMKNPGQFWIQKVGPPSVDLDKLLDNMTEFYSQEENREVYVIKDPLEAGDMVATQFSMDKKWYRAMVRDIVVDEYDMDQSIVDVYYVDYGDDEKKKQSDLCKLKLEFLMLRHQAIECALAGIMPKGDQWSEDASDLFEELSYAARWKPIMAKVQGYREQIRGDRATSPVPVIDLIDSSSSQDINIGDELVRQGFALRQTSGGGGTSPAQNGTCSPSSSVISKDSKVSIIAGGEESWDEDEDGVDFDTDF